MNTDTIRLIQTARRKAGIEEGRYRFLLRQYKQPNGKPAESCKQLDRRQIDNLLGICESMGWRHPGKSETYYRDKSADSEIGGISTAAMGAIRHLAGDLGWTIDHLNNFVAEKTNQRAQCLVSMTPHEGWEVTEALIAILGRRDGVRYKTLADVQRVYATH